MARAPVETIGSGKHLQLLRERGWEFADRVRGRGVVAVIAVTDQDELVLTEQYRVPVKRRVVDLPAGLAGDVDGEEEEAFEVAARRELVEETGYDGETFEYAFSGPTSAGMTTEMMTFFIARNVRKVASGGGDDGEAIRVQVVPLKKIYRWLRKKETARTCVDPKVYAALGVLAKNDPKA